MFRPRFSSIQRYFLHVVCVLPLMQAVCSGDNLLAPNRLFAKMLANLAAMKAARRSSSCSQTSAQLESFLLGASFAAGMTSGWPNPGASGTYDKGVLFSARPVGCWRLQRAAGPFGRLVSARGITVLARSVEIRHPRCTSDGAALVGGFTGDALRRLGRSCGAGRLASTGAAVFACSASAGAAVHPGNRWFLAMRSLKCGTYCETRGQRASIFVLTSFKSTGRTRRRVETTWRPDVGQFDNRFGILSDRRTRRRGFTDSGCGARCRPLMLVARRQSGAANDR